MRFTCPSCQTVYDVPDGKIQNAPKMRCKICNHVWKITPHFEENPPETEKTESVDPFAGDIDENDFSRFVPKREEPEEDPPAALDDFLETPFFEKTHAKNQKIRAALCFLLLGLGLFAAGIAIKAFNSNPPPPVGFENVSYHFAEEDYKRFLVLSGKLVNKTDQPASVALFFVRFFNKSNINLANQKIPVVLPVLPPEGTQPFTLRIERPPSSAERIELILKDVSLLPSEQSAAVTQTTANPTEKPAFPPASEPAE